VAARCGGVDEARRKTMIRIGPLALALALAGFVLLCGPAAAQSAQPENEDNRFSFFHADGGYLQLDGRTGQVALCTRRPAGWLCQAVPQERAALEAEIARLQAQNAALKKELLAHDLPLPGGVAGDSPPAAGPGLSPGTDREGSQIMSVIGDVWRRLVAMITSVQRDLLRRS
jgi:hypothetical protein